MRALIFDPFAGAAGDMTLAALVDLGLPVEWLHSFAASLALGDVRVVSERVRRAGIECARVAFEIPEQRGHRHLRQILEIIDGATLSVPARERARDAFNRIGVAEAAVHGTTLEQVHFHEVGAVDAILDVLGTMAAVEQLGFEAFYTRPIAVGGGSVDIEHGRYPVPAPATLRILEGLPVTGFELDGECTTPTGAALIATLTGGAPPPAELIVTGSGYGAGTRDPEGRPNALRLIAANIPAPTPGASVLLQADIDDMPPEYAGAALEAILEAGALDAVMLPLAMKKGRPGQRLEALAPAARVDDVAGAMLRHTTTLGIRFWPLQRVLLDRNEQVLEWRGQRIRRKMVRFPDGTSRAKPEYEDVLRAARALGIPALEVRSALESELPPSGG
ncbi:MAG TPA: nickel pincer cofactor biosynthesis protein LarC [Longimicrobiales bacterium]|nr:nickel pincer cofactor biosynthesis protein LarC [Longimicrobiales bacterium]